MLEERAGFAHPKVTVNGEWLYRVGQEGYPSFTFSSHPEQTVTELQRKLHRAIEANWDGPPVCVAGVFAHAKSPVRFVRYGVVAAERTVMLSAETSSAGSP